MCSTVTVEPTGGAGIATQSKATESVVEFGSGLHGVLQHGGDRAAVLISHGAGSGLTTPLLEKTANRLVADGFTTLRWNFGYLDQHRAPSSGSKREIAQMEEAIELLKGRSQAPLILIGKSFGARVSSYVAPDREDVAALVFYGLPLHGMAKNAKPRDWSHLAHIHIPTLFITGDHDQLARTEHLLQVQQLMGGPYFSEIVPGDHSFKPRSEDLAVDIAVSWLNDCF